MIKKSQLQNKSIWFVVFILAWGVYHSATKANTIGSTQVQSDTKSEIPATPQPTQATTDSTSVAQTSAPNSAQTYTVTRVIDGDTIVIDTGQTVRYIGIDTPETVHPDKPTMCFGPEASQKNKDLVLGKKVTLEKDISETDKYKRLLRYVWVDGSLINELLVKEGYAVSSTYPPDVKYQDIFVAAQKTAQQNKSGMWGKCQFFGETSSSSIPTPATNNDSSNCTIKGNISSSGEKIFHVSGCGSYSKTVIDTSSGERYFCTEAEAVAAGWRKAKNCN
jgi:micrococcal nuclease